MKGVFSVTFWPPFAICTVKLPTYWSLLTLKQISQISWYLPISLPIKVVENMLHSQVKISMRTSEMLPFQNVAHNFIYLDKWTQIMLRSLSKNEKHVSRKWKPSMVVTLWACTKLTLYEHLGKVSPHPNMLNFWECTETYSTLVYFLFNRYDVHAQIQTIFRLWMPVAGSHWHQQELSIISTWGQHLSYM